MDNYSNKHIKFTRKLSQNPNYESHFMKLHYANCSTDISTRSPCILFMELAAGGDLENYVNKTHQNGTLIPIATKIMWLVQVLDALNFMHRMGIAHLDLTPANVVLTGPSNMTAKVLDILNDFMILKF